jgi:hypothetical protein
MAARRSVRLLMRYPYLRATGMAGEIGPAFSICFLKHGFRVSSAY